MKFSIIIPAHNMEKYIRKTLDSIREQDFKDYECIVVCDDCTDETEHIARQYDAITVPVRVNNDGLARNVGLDISRGEYILFIDADDWYVHEFVLSQLAQRIEEKPDADVIAYAIIWKYIGYVPAMSNRGVLFPHCTNKCWKKSIIAQTRFPDVYPDSDAKFHELMMEKHPMIDLWDMPIYYYNYLREGSASSTLRRTVEITKSYWRMK